MQYRPCDLDDADTTRDAVMRVNSALIDLWKATGGEVFLERLAAWIVRRLPAAAEP